MFSVLRRQTPPSIFYLSLNNIISISNWMYEHLRTSRPDRKCDYFPFDTSTLSHTLNFIYNLFFCVVDFFFFMFLLRLPFRKRQPTNNVSSRATLYLYDIFHSLSVPTTHSSKCIHLIFSEGCLASFLFMISNAQNSLMIDNVIN